MTAGGLARSRYRRASTSINSSTTPRGPVMDTIAPVGAVEQALAEHVAALLWRLQRLTAYETAAIDERQHLEQLSARLLPHPDTIDRIIRHEAHLVRQLLQLLRELE